jgi:ABC-2 type transport system ATP-binding protein
VNAIRIEGLHKAYGKVKALDGLSLTVEPNTVFGFLGPNGAGKTTTLRILAGLARPDRGAAWVAGEAVGPDSPARGLVGYLPEEPRAYAWMTPQEFLGTYVGGLFGMSARESRSRCAELLELVGLQDAAHRRVAGFSRGMRQRLGLAQALMNKPRVVLLDEPVSALDPAGRRDMLLLIERLKAEATVFMSTHILEDVERVCDTVGIIHQGRLVVVDERQALLDRYAVPAVEVEFEASRAQEQAWRREIAGKPFVTGVAEHEQTIRVRLDGSPQARVEMAQLVLGSGLPVARFAVARPTLEDVFLGLVENGAPLPTAERG